MSEQILPKPKVLVTGAAGKVARACASFWSEELDLRLTDLYPASANMIGADLTDFRQVYDLLQGVDAVVHLAIAPPRIAGNDYRPDEANPEDILRLRVNVDGAYNILEASRRLGVRRVVFMSSLTVHLGNKHRPWYSSETPLEPANLYACTKLFGENLARVYWQTHGLSTICLRLGQPFPIDTPELDDAWRTRKRARSTFAEIGDVARAVLCGIRTEVPFGIFNLVSASDNQRFDLEAARAIGFVPKAYLSDSGVAFYEDGEFPPPSGVPVTHD